MFQIKTKIKEVVGQGTGDSSTKWCEWCEPISSYEEFLKIRREAREIVDEIRSCDDEERRKELKKKLPAVVWAAGWRARKGHQSWYRSTLMGLNLMNFAKELNRCCLRRKTVSDFLFSS